MRRASGRPVFRWARIVQASFESAASDRLDGSAWSEPSRVAARGHGSPTDRGRMGCRTLSRCSRNGRSSGGTGTAWPGDQAGELLRESHLGRFLRSTGEPALDALQARATADPAWFWGAAADDLGLAWERRPDDGHGHERRARLRPVVARWRAQLRCERPWGRASPATRTAPRSPGKARTARSGGLRTASSRRRSISRSGGCMPTGSGRAIGSGSCCRCWSRRSSRSSPWAG